LHLDKTCNSFERQEKLILASIVFKGTNNMTMNRSMLKVNKKANHTNSSSRLDHGGWHKKKTILTFVSSAQHSSLH